jgi:hypothetical protein
VFFYFGFWREPGLPDLTIATARGTKVDRSDLPLPSPKKRQKNKTRNRRTSPPARKKKVRTDVRAFFLKKKVFLGEFENTRKQIECVSKKATGETFVL